MLENNEREFVSDIPLPWFSVLWIPVGSSTGRFKMTSIEWDEMFLLICEFSSSFLYPCLLQAARAIILCLISRLIELSEGRFSRLQTFSLRRRSRSSHEKIPGCSLLYCSIFCSILGVITLGLPTLAPPGLIDPVFWYFDRSLLMQPWVIFKRRLMSQGRTPTRANSIISSRISFGKGFPLM